MCLFVFDVILYKKFDTYTKYSQVFNFKDNSELSKYTKNCAKAQKTNNRQTNNSASFEFENILLISHKI